MYKKVIYWFKRDLRIDDNKAFYIACENSKEIIPIFIFVPSLLEKFRAYDNRLGFIIECLKNLSDEIKILGGKLFCYYDEPDIVFDYLIEKYKPEAIYTNKAFSYLGEEIESKVIKLSDKKRVFFHSIVDNFLSNTTKIPYRKVFSAFYKKWKENLNLDTVSKPKKINTPKINERSLNDILNILKFEENKYWKPTSAYERIKDFDFKAYEYSRNRLDMDGTSKLSPYIRFGVISLRKLYMRVLNSVGDDCQYIKELAWREFWYNIKVNFSDFRDLEFQEKRRNIKWQNNDELIKAFMDAKTGYPIIDASLRQLKTEGWMHNRARMIVASFLTKDLLIDWRIGERFFMEHLIDYDEIVNIGNWQWNASVGPDPKPFRIFNPIVQAKKFDPEGVFIKKYIPELRKIPANLIHDPLKYKIPYYKPIVNHYQRVILARKIYFYR